jgi:zinc D-Ala-D-Ala carboxypeptidase
VFTRSNNRAAVPTRRPPRFRRPGPSRIRVLAAVLGLAVGCLGVTFARPDVIRAADPVPACRFSDTVTPVRGFDRVADTLVDTALGVGRGYVPPDLVSATQAKVNAGFQIRGLIVPDLRALVVHARRAGVRIRLVSAYRSYAAQATLLAAYTKRLGRAAALRQVARPGHSEHQLGVALDIAATRGAYAWASRNAWRYGFVLSYPRGRTATTCYRYEPWHLRWVGRPRAADVHASALVYRVWLWRNVADARP